MATYTSNYGWTKPSGSDNVDISVLNDNLDDQDSTIHDAFLNMAPPFSESSTYSVDDIVLYGTGLYKCHTAVVTPGSWTGSTNWQVYKLSEGGSGGGGTSNYNQLTNKPQINSVELSGNKTTAQLGLMASDGVVANPTGQTTGTLTALEVGGTKYAVGGGETKNLDNGMLSHSTDSGYITVNLDVPLTAGKEYKITLRDPSYNYVSTKIIVWNGQVDVIFDGPAGATEYKIRLTQTTASLYNYGGTGWRDIYCDIVSDFSSESYNDLSNKPSINGVTLSGNKTTSDLGISYNDLTNKPSIPTKTSDLTNDSNFVSDANYVHTDNNFTTSEKNKLAGIASGAEANVQANWSQTNTSADDFIKNKPNLANVATSGSYADLTSKPQVNGVELSGNKTTSDLGINADNVMLSDGVTSVEDAVDEAASGLTALSIGKLSINKQAIQENTSVNIELDFGGTYLLVLTAGYGGFGIVALLSTNFQSNSVKIDKIIDNGSGVLAVASLDASHVAVTVGGLGYDAKLGIMPVA